MIKTLYRRSYDGILLSYLSSAEARDVLKEVNDGICDAHQLGPKLKDRLHMLGYYWPTMIIDVVQYARQYKIYQIHADFIHQLPELLHPTIASWSFEEWGIDVIRPISLPSARGHRFIFAIIDYFSQWAEVIPLAEVKTTNVITSSNTMSSTDLVSPIIHDNGPQFAS